MKKVAAVSLITATGSGTALAIYHRRNLTM